MLVRVLDADRLAELARRPADEEGRLELEVEQLAGPEAGLGRLVALIIQTY